MTPGNKIPRDTRGPKTQSGTIDKVKMLLAAGAIAGTLGGWGLIAQQNADTTAQAGSSETAVTSLVSPSATPSLTLITTSQPTATQQMFTATPTVTQTTNQEGEATATQTTEATAPAASVTATSTPQPTDTALPTATATPKPVTNTRSSR